MKKITFLSILALITIFSCSRDVIETEATDPNLQASASYDPNDAASVVLNSHSVYGPMILDDNPNIGAAGGVEIIWDGPWIEWPPHGCPHPFKENFAGGYCDNKGTICGIIITAGIQEIFNLEGVSTTSQQVPGVLIRVFNDRSDMTLVADFEDVPACGTHAYSVLKQL